MLKSEAGTGHRRGRPPYHARPVVPVPSAVSTLVKDFVERGRPDDQQFDILTWRELQVLKLIAEAHTPKKIARSW